LSFANSLAFHHIALSVTDMDRATWFYSEVLGLEKIERPPFDFGGAWYQLGEHTLHLIVHPPTRTLRHSMEIGPREGTWRCACAIVRSDRPPARARHRDPGPARQPDAVGAGVLLRPGRQHHRIQRRTT
jgi:catechol 2,3-dioxygenase-like lactoylglutathione lyase family enzyme